MVAPFIERKRIALCDRAKPDLAPDRVEKRHFVGVVDDPPVIKKNHYLFILQKAAIKEPEVLFKAILIITKKVTHSELLTLMSTYQNWNYRT